MSCRIASHDRLFDRIGQQLQQQSQPQMQMPMTRGNEIGRNEMGLDRLHAATD